MAKQRAGVAGSPAAAVGRRRSTRGGGRAAQSPAPCPPSRPAPPARHQQRVRGVNARALTPHLTPTWPPSRAAAAPGRVRPPSSSSAVSGPYRGGWGQPQQPRSAACELLPTQTRWVRARLACLGCCREWGIAPSTRAGSSVAGGRGPPPLVPPPPPLDARPAFTRPSPPPPSPHPKQQQQQGVGDEEEEKWDLDQKIEVGKLIDAEGAGRSVFSPGWLTQLGRLWGGKSVSEGCCGGWASGCRGHAVRG